MARITAASSLGWAHYTLYEALPRLKAHGFSQVEIASFHSYCFHFNFGSPTPPELRQMLDGFQLKPICLNYSPGSYQAWVREDMDRFVADRAKKLVQLAEVGIPMMTMLFGERNQRPDQELQLARAVEVYDRVGEIAKGLGIRMLLEVPHLYTIHPGADQVLWIFDHLSSSNVGALVDTSHWGIIQYDPAAFLGALGDRLWHVHLRDSAGPDTADRKQRLELTPGQGTVDFQKFAQTLDRLNYRGDVSLDFEYRDMTLEAIDHEFDTGLKYLSQNGWELPETVRTALK